MKEVIEFVGITSAIVGVILLYKYSISVNYKKGSATYFYTTKELKEIKIKEEKIEKYYRKMSIIGLIFSILSILISFLVQTLK